MSRFRRRFSLASNLAASSGVSLSLPTRAAGLWSGVIVRNVKVPWRSGFPSGVRGGCHARDWAAAEAAISRLTARTLPTATRYRACIASSKIG